MSKMPNNEAVSPARHDESIDNSPEAFFNALEDRIHSSLRVMIPAVVLAYQRKTHELWVQPLVAMTDTAGRAITSGALPCTAIRHYSGKYLFDMPISRGDTGWLIAADRDTSKVKEDYDANNTKLSPRESENGNTHQYEYGFFIPDKWFRTSGKDANRNTIKLTDEDIEEERMVIQSGDSTQRISIGQTDIKVYATDTTVNIEKTATVNVGERATITCPVSDIYSDRITIDPNTADKARVKINGNLFVTNTVYVENDIVVSVNEDTHPLSANYTFKSHVHGLKASSSGTPVTTSSPYCHKMAGPVFVPYTTYQKCVDADIGKNEDVETNGFNH